MYRKIIILGPCRSGTTFVLNALSNDQYDGYFQICKNDVRKKLAEDAPDNDLLSVMGDSPFFVAKEALGPYFIEEVNIDPIAKILVPDDYADALIIFCLREPHSCFLSWEKSFGNKKAINHQVFNQAYSQLKQLYENYHDKIRTAVLILDDKELFQERIGKVIRDMYPFEKKMNIVPITNIGILNVLKSKGCLIKQCLQKYTVKRRLRFTERLISQQYKVLSLFISFF